MPSLPCQFQNEAISTYSEASAGKTTTGPPAKWICMRHRRRCSRLLYPSCRLSWPHSRGRQWAPPQETAATIEPPSCLETFSSTASLSTCNHSSKNLYCLNLLSNINNNLNKTQRKHLKHLDLFYLKKPKQFPFIHVFLLQDFGVRMIIKHVQA